MDGDVLIFEQYFFREGQRSQDVLLENLLRSPAIGQPAQNQLDRYTRPPDDRFSDQHGRIAGGTFSPIHPKRLV